MKVRKTVRINEAIETNGFGKVWAAVFLSLKSLTSILLS
jgi:hypothetical protein